jgi:hypothetical protein
MTQEESSTAIPTLSLSSLLKTEVKGIIPKAVCQSRCHLGWPFVTPAILNGFFVASTMWYNIGLAGGQSLARRPWWKQSHQGYLWLAGVKLLCTKKI